MVKLILAAITVVGGILLWFLKRNYGKAGHIESLKNDLAKKEAEDKKLADQQKIALVLHDSPIINRLYFERERLSREIAAIRDKLRQEGVDS